MLLCGGQITIYRVLYMYRMLLSLRVYRGGIDGEDRPGAISGAVLSKTGDFSTIISGGAVV